MVVDTIYQQKEEKYRRHRHKSYVARRQSMPDYWRRRASFITPPPPSPPPLIFVPSNHQGIEQSSTRMGRSQQLIRRQPQRKSDCIINMDVVVVKKVADLITLDTNNPDQAHSLKQLEQDEEMASIKGQCKDDNDNDKEEPKTEADVQFCCQLDYVDKIVCSIIFLLAVTLSFVLLLSSS